MICVVKGHNSINIRTVVAFREIGQGYEGLEIFGTLVNVPGLLLKSLYNDINKKRISAYVDSAKESLANAAQQVRDIVNRNADMNGVVETDICINGYW